MHFIKEIIKYTTTLFFLCLGITQMQNKITPVILLENSEITNRKNEFYTIEKNSLKLFAISTKNKYNKTRFVVERFFAWLKNGFHRTRIRYERIADNYLGFVYLASIMMYWRVLG